MKSILFVLVSIITNTITIYAQYNFEYISSTQKHEYSTYAVEKSNGNYIVSTIRRVDMSLEYITDFIELSPMGETIQTYSIIDTNYSYLPVYMEVINDTIHAIGFCTEHASQNSFLWHSTLNSSLEIIEQDIYLDGPDQVFSVSDVEVISNNGWVITGWRNFDYGGQGIVAIINHNGELTQHKLYSINTSNAPGAIMQRKEGGFVFKRSYGGFVLIDDELEVDTIIPYNFIPIEAEYNSPHAINALNDSTFFISGRHFIGSAAESNLAVNKIENLTNLTAEHIVYTDTTSFTAIVNSLDFRYNDKIYCGGWQFNPLTPPYFSPYFSTLPGWFILTQYNEDLTSNWTRFYGGDMYYIMAGVLATKDGGCLMYGQRYDPENDDKGQDIYLLKVGPNGLLTSTTTPENASDITVYPNPTTNYIFFDTGEASMYEVSFFDGLGKVIFQEKIPNNSPVDVRHLPVGMYTYVLERKGKIVSQGKWMKE